MNKLYLALLLIIFTTSTQANQSALVGMRYLLLTEDPKNLIINGDFETGDLTGWTREGLGGYAFYHPKFYNFGSGQYMLEVWTNKDIKQNIHIENKEVTMRFSVDVGWKSYGIINIDGDVTPGLFRESLPAPTFITANRVPLPISNHFTKTFTVPDTESTLYITLEFQHPPATPLTNTVTAIDNVSLWVVE